MKDTGVSPELMIEMAKEIDPSVVSVVVGTDFKLSARKMALASLYINNGALLVGTNIDRNDGKDRLRPSGGSLVKLIEVGSDAPTPKVMGKPDTLCFEILKQQHGLEEVENDKFLMVGDNLATDVMFGNQCSIDTLLVLSGVTTPQKAERVLKGEVGSGLEAEGVPTHVQSLFA